MQTEHTLGAQARWPIAPERLHLCLPASLPDGVLAPWRDSFQKCANLATRVTTFRTAIHLPESALLVLEALTVLRLHADWPRHTT